ncbi:Hypothetical protein D9617_2g053510 [Elsinoe fawcettii]|nr:Hypothetical protein D9617_2g053510 [Elsinoe fawcettii]
MARHSRQGSDDSPGQLSSDNCCCIACTCSCSCRREQHDYSDIDNEYTLVDSDSSSITSEEPEDINQPNREPTPGLLALEAQARHLRPLLRNAHAISPDLVREEAAWIDIMQYILEVEHLRQNTPSPSMEASFVSSAPQSHDDLYEYPGIQGSMLAQASSRSPLSSMENSMYISFTSSRQSSNGSGHTFRTNSSTVLEGIGALFDYPNWFTTTPLKLNAEAEYCLSFAPPRRSLSLPAIKVDQTLDAMEESA